MTDRVATSWQQLDALVNGPVRTRGQRHRELTNIFNAGETPDVARGSYRGMLSGAFNPVVDAIGTGVKALWMPWVGKHLEPGEGRGFNLLKPGSERILQRLLGGPPTHRCGRLRAGYEFGYRVGDSALPGAPRVGRIEYADIATNPAFLRRLHDEIVQVDDRVLLGRFIAPTDRGPRVTAWFALRGPVIAPTVERA